MPQLHSDSPLKLAVCLFWGRPTSPGPVWYLCILVLRPHWPRTGVVTRLAKNLTSVVWAKLCILPIEAAHALWRASESVFVGAETVKVATFSTSLSHSAEFLRPSQKPWQSVRSYVRMWDIERTTGAEQWALCPLGWGLIVEEALLRVIPWKECPH